MPLDPAALKLGKKPGVVEDPRTFRLTSLVEADALLTYPRRHRVGGEKAAFPMLANDRYGVCAFASQCHQVISNERASGQSRAVRVTELDALKAYSEVTGFDPSKPWTDNGTYMLDALNHWRHKGLGKEKDGTPHVIHAFARVDHRNLDEVRYAAWAFGGLYVGAWLPLSAADQLGAGQTWEQVGGERGRPGTWGGHAMHLRGYDPVEAEFVTWGARQQATWAWWLDCVDECYAVISEDLIRSGTKRTPQGFDVAALEEKLARL
jgi:hypothetical protein